VPAGDTALDVSTGSIYKAGALFIHTKGAGANTAVGDRALADVTTGYGNTASGFEALRDNTIGINNTASGYRALRSNTTGVRNTASGAEALRSNTTGFANTASGYRALRFNTTGFANTACGFEALHYNTTAVYNTASGFRALHRDTSGSENTACGHSALFTNTTGDQNTASGSEALGYNTTGFRNTAGGSRALRLNTNGFENLACGYSALDSNTTGDRNIAVGVRAGRNLTTGNDNIALGNESVAGESATIRMGTAGTHTRAFIAGIRGVTTANANAIPVLVDSAGQLGTISSSRRFKQDIADMGDRTERLLALRPVVFRYRELQTLPDGSPVPLEYGLIAEEVAEVFPELVVNDEEGQPFTVKYHLLSSMLLNVLKQQAHQLEEQRSELAWLRGLEGRVAALETRAR
jgi:hypothetical protein